ncbi:MAG: radical SAM protein [Bacteroidales bacterium]
MKVRIEPDGVHCYDRVSGLHILIDEIKTNLDHYSLAPRTVSIAITDKCDFECSYCHVNLKNNFLEKDVIINYCKTLDNFGTFDIAFGGGEPTLHPDLIEICQQVWNETNLGISITTHGHHLSPDKINSLMGRISLLRFSIDGIEPIYSQLRHKPLKNLIKVLEYTNGKIPIGFNTVVNSLTIKGLDELLEFAIQYKIAELLLLPMINKGRTSLKDNEWNYLSEWINRNKDKVPLRISIFGKENLHVPLLFNSDYWDSDYAFIGADKIFRENSYEKQGIEIKYNFDTIIKNWKSKHLEKINTNYGLIPINADTQYI